MNKKILISLITILVIVIIGGVGYYIWSNNEKEKEELAYQSKLYETFEMLDTSTLNSAIIASTYQEYWGDIIDRSIPFSTLSKELKIPETTIDGMVNVFQHAYYSDGLGLLKGEINTMIAIVKTAKSDEIETVLEEHELISNAISELKNPPEKFKENYDSILEVYELYDSFVSISTSPVGSHIEYSKNINSSYERLSSKINTVKLQLN